MSFNYRRHFLLDIIIQPERAASAPLQTNMAEDATMGQDHSHSKANSHGLSLDSILNGDLDAVENTASHDEASADESLDDTTAQGFCVECEGEQLVTSEAFLRSLSILSRPTSTTFLRDV